LPNAE